MRKALYAAIFISGLALYAATLNADVQPADGGELQVAGWLLGIPHPPGYPLYTVLAWLMARVPIGMPYARMSLLSAIFAAGTLALVAACVGGCGRKTRLNVVFAALIAAATLATSTTFWAQATTTNVRSLTALFTAMLLVVFIHRPAWLIGFAAVLGLALGHHASLIFVGALLGAIFLLRWMRARTGVDRGTMTRGIALAVAAGVATQLVWLYLPLRDAQGAHFAPGGLTSVDGLLFHIFARGFAGDMFAFARPEFVWDRIALLPTLFQFQFGVPVLIAMFIAALALLIRRTGLALTLLAAATLHLFVTLTYRAPQTVEYALPAWVLVCTVFGLGMREILDWGTEFMDSRYRNAAGHAGWLAQLVCVVACLPVTMLVGREGIARYSSYAQLAQGAGTRTAAQGVLETAAPGSTVFAQWHEAAPMWALQDIENFRPDVKVTYVPPAGAQTYEATFAMRAREAISTGRPAYTTSFFAREFEALGVCAIPQNGLPAWELFACPITTRRADAVIFDGRLGVQSIKLAENNVGLGGAVGVILTVVARGQIADGDSVTVRIMLPDGRVGANVDFRLDGALKPGEVFAARKLMGMPPARLRDGTYSISVGAYNGARQFTTTTGVPYIGMTEVTVQPSTPTRVAIGGIHFGDAMTLLGATARRQGTRVVVDLDWLGLRPLTGNYTISARLEGEGIYKTHDSEPALGAIPTLKWIEGSRITDRHVFDVGASSVPLRGTVVVYNGNDRVELPITSEYVDGQPMFTVAP